jgi:hypothetical protein
MLDVKRSLMLGQEIEAAPKHCYQNASYALFQLYDEGQADGVSYVEGYAVDPSHPPIIPIKHAWLESDSGEIIDPSLWAYAKQYGHTKPQFTSYHPAIRFTYAEFVTRYKDQQFLPLASEGEQHKRALEEAYKVLRPS